MTSLLENRIFRVVLLIITLVVFYLWIVGFSGGDEVVGEDRGDAAEEEIALTETATAEQAETRVVISSTPTASTTAVAESVLEYEIESGDTLNAIAVKFNTTEEAVRLANPGIQPGNLFAGDTIRILGASTDANAVANPDPTDREEGVEAIYFVDPGDTLGDIALDYTVSLEALMAANPGVDQSNLQVGQELTIPEFGAGIPPEQLTPEPTPQVLTRPAGEATVHEVSEGDSIVYLSVIYQVDVDTILAANPNLDPDNIAVGQQIQIPPPQLGP